MLTLSVDQLMQPYAGVAPGASVPESFRDGAAVFRRGYSMANLEGRTPATPVTNYRLASVTKQFTAAAILLLAGRPRIRYRRSGASVAASLPAGGRCSDRAPPAGAHLRADRLRRWHTARRSRARSATRMSSKSSSKWDRYLFAPGASYRCSNSGYALLALIVEKASGKSFATFLHERILRPLGMNATVAFKDGVSSVPNRAFRLQPGERNMIGAGSTRTARCSATAAVLYSSINDLSPGGTPRFMTSVC